MENQVETLQRWVQCALKRYYHVTPSSEAVVSDKGGAL